MAAKTKGPPALPPDQLDVARALYLRRGATPQWVASQLDPPAHWRAVEAAARSLGWVDERVEREAARVRSSKYTAEEQAALEVEQDERHAAIARRELDLREAVVERAHEALVGMTPKEALSALRGLAGAKDLQFVERMARGRSTEKIEADAAENLRSLSESILEALKAAPKAEPPPPPPPPAKGGNGNGNGNGNGKDHR